MPDGRLSRIDELKLCRRRDGFDVGERRDSEPGCLASVTASRTRFSRGLAGEGAAVVEEDVAAQEDPESSGRRPPTAIAQRSRGTGAPVGPVVREALEVQEA